MKLKLRCYRWVCLLSRALINLKLYGPALCGKLFIFTLGLKAGLWKELCYVGKGVIEIAMQHLIKEAKFTQNNKFVFYRLFPTVSLLLLVNNINYWPDTQKCRGEFGLIPTKSSVCTEFSLDVSFFSSSLNCIFQFVNGPDVCKWICPTLWRWKPTVWRTQVICSYCGCRCH